MVRRLYWQRATPWRGRRSGTKRKVQPSDVLKAEQQLALKIARAMDELRIGDAVLFGEVIVTIEHSKAVTVRFERNHKLSFIKPEPEVKAA